MNDITELVKMALNGDRAAFDSLYEQTKGGVWFTCISLLKNEENAKDIMQDTYLAAFDNLGTLENPAAFRTWLNKIAANKCKNFISAKANSTLASGSEEILENVPDDKFLPEEYVMNAEKRRIIMDIIEDALSVNQYRTIILYYFDEMTVSEIAELMDCHEKTVQYRLKTARLKIKEEVKRYEEQNRDKLHAVAPFMLLTQLFRAQAESISVPSTPAIPTASPDPSNALNVPSNSAATAVKTGGKAMLNSLKAKIIAGTCAAVVVGGGVTAGVLISNNSKNNTENDISKPSFAVSSTDKSNSKTDIPKPDNNDHGESTLESKEESPIVDQTVIPQFEGLTPIKLLRSTGDYREHDPDIISGNIKDAYLTEKRSYVLLTNDGELFLYNLEIGDYTPISLGKDTGISKLDNLLFTTDGNNHSLLAVDGNNVFYKSVNSEGKVNTCNDTGNERSAQGVLFEGRNMRSFQADMHLSNIYAIDENGYGFKLYNRFGDTDEYITQKGVYADASECFFYYPNETDSYIYNGMKIKQRVGLCFIAEDDKLYYHRAGSTLASETPIKELESFGFESIYHSRLKMFDYTCYAGVTKDGKVMVFNVEENSDNNGKAEIVFNDNKPDGDIQNIWVNSERVVVKTDKGCFYAKYEEDNTLKPFDTLNALAEEVVYLCNSDVLLSNGYLYKIDEFNN